MRMSTVKMLLLKLCLINIAIITQARGSASIQHRGLRKITNTKDRVKRENFFWEGCSSEGIPGNARISCSASTGCRSTCIQGKTFPNGKTSLDLECRGGRWRTSSGGYISDCHGGDSEEFNWEGCTTAGLPNGARISCSSDTGCDVTCSTGYQLTNGASHLNLQCRSGQWTYYGHTRLPECQAVCSPSCQNGGECLNPGVCRCTDDFRGSHCQYPLRNCDIKAVDYDGGYSCSWNNIRYSCDLYCTTKEDAITHTCTFDSGKWSPPIIKCNPDVETFDPDALARGEITFP